jgi:HrpA-like RNA helicase
MVNVKSLSHILGGTDDIDTVFIRNGWNSNIGKSDISGGSDAPIAILNIPGNLQNVSTEINKRRPIEYIKDKIQTIRFNDLASNVFILKAGTGTGKTVIFPVELYRAYPNLHITCCVPTILIAETTVKTIMTINPSLFTFGKNIGVITGVKKNSAHGIVIITTGILLQTLRSILSSELSMNDPSYPHFILIDEAHRRPLDIEICLVLIKYIINKFKKNAPFFVFMSATIDTDQLLSYYGITSDHLVEVQGQTSIRKDIYITKDSKDLNKTILETLVNIRENKYDRVLSVNDASDVYGGAKSSKKTKKANANKKKEDKREKKATDVNAPETTIQQPIDDTIVYTSKKTSDDVSVQQTHIIDDDPDVSRYSVHDPINQRSSEVYELSFTKSSKGKHENNNVNQNNIKALFRERKIVHTDTNPNFTSGDILLFAPTKGMIKNLHALISNWVVANNLPIIVISLTSILYAELSEEVMWLTRDIKTYKINNKYVERRIIISTNVAESGVTFSDLKYVIDTGLVNTVEFNPHTNASFVMIKPLTKDAAQQRIGRVGRHLPGISINMYTKDTFDNLTEYSIADILKSDFSSSYLLLREANIHLSDLIDKPFTEMIYYVEDKLYTLGFIDNMNNITDLGKYATNFTLIPVESVKMILSAYAYGVCAADLVTIAAVIEKTSINTTLPLCDQFISALLIFEYSVFGKQLFLQHDIDDKSVIELGLDKVISDVDLREILKLRWDIVRSLGQCKLSLYNVPSHIPEIYKYISDFHVMDRYKVGNNVQDIMQRMRDHPSYDVISRIKRCIYEGFKLNTIYNVGCQSGSKYNTINGLHVNAPQMYAKNSTDIYGRLGISVCDMPRLMVAHKFDIKPDRRSGKSMLFADCVSVMDGYIGYDESIIAKTITADSDIRLTADEFAAYQKSIDVGDVVHGRIVIDGSCDMKAVDHDYYVDRKIAASEYVSGYNDFNDSDSDNSNVDL